MNDRGPRWPLRVLIVENCADTRTSMCALVDLWGHESRAAADGEAALRLAAVFRPDVVLLDLGMPRMDGFEVARRLRKDVGLHDARLIAVTGHAGKRTEAAALAAGIGRVLVKPADPAEVERALQVCRAMLGATLAREVRDPSARPTCRPHLREQGLGARLKRSHGEHVTKPRVASIWGRFEVDLVPMENPGC